MAVINQNLEITKPFWAVVRTGDPKGYHTGSAGMETILIQADTATELSDVLGEGSVESGESMGDFVFNVKALSHSWDILNQIIESEEFDKAQKEMVSDF